MKWRIPSAWALWCWQYLSPANSERLLARAAIGNRMTVKLDATQLAALAGGAAAFLIQGRGTRAAVVCTGRDYSGQGFIAENCGPIYATLPKTLLFH